MNYFISALKKYAIFRGRSGRKEFWYFVLFNAIFSTVTAFLDYLFGTSSVFFGTYGLISSIYYLSILVPNIAVAVRRLHDVNKSGWMLLISAVPQILILGTLIYLSSYLKINQVNFIDNIPLLLQSNIIIWIILLTVLMIASFVGSIWLLILFFRKGTHGHNKYSLSHKEKEDAMEKLEETPEKHENKKENNEQKITIPIAVIVAGFLIMVGLLATGGINGGGANKKDKTLSEQVGVNKASFDACMKITDLQELKTTTDASAELAMKGLPLDQRGTPYAVIIGKNGSKAEIRGAYPKEDVQKLIDEVKSGKVTNPYKGEVPRYQEGDHIIGSSDAEIIVIEYADLECPYCSRFSGTMKEITSESGGNVAWIYRHWVVHQTALPKAGAAECVAKLKGNDAFWKYIDLVFGLMEPEEAPVSEQL